MRCITKMIAPAAVIAAALTCMAGPVAAQEGTPTYMAGVSTRMGAGCPATEWHIKPVPPTGAVTISGVAYFADMSGISRIAGTRTATGAISGDVISIWGNGPTGKFTGQRTANSVHVELIGPGCSRHVVDMHPLADNFYGGQG
jgi:hypothetical protein